MGYMSKLRGELTIQGKPCEYPEDLIRLAGENNIPLPGNNGLPESVTDFYPYKDYFVLHSKKAVPFNGVESSYNDLEDAIAEIISLAAANECVVNGDIVRLGEEQGDIERFHVQDNVLSVQRASLVWDDGTPVADEYYIL